MQRSLGWATTKKSITMTGQAKRKSSMVALHSFDLPADTRKNSLKYLLDDERNSIIDENSESNSLADDDEYSRRSSLLDRQSSLISNGEGDRTNSIEHPAEDVSKAYEELLKYSARKFSIFVPADDDEKTILDDADYFMSKKECDYGMCQCCPVQKKLQTNWESIEEIIENDPEIIFDSDDNPIVVEPVHSENSNGNHSEILPSVFKSLYDKLSQTSLL